MTIYFFLNSIEFDNTFSKGKETFMSFTNVYPQLYQFMIFVFKESHWHRSLYRIAVSVCLRCNSTILTEMFHDISTCKAIEAKKKKKSQEIGTSQADIRVHAVVRMNDN